MTDTKTFDWKALVVEHEGEERLEPPVVYTFNGGAREFTEPLHHVIEAPAE